MGEEAGGCSGSLHGLGPVLPPCLPLLGGASSEGPSILHPPSSETCCPRGGFIVAVPLLVVGPILPPGWPAILL